VSFVHQIFEGFAVKNKFVAFGHSAIRPFDHSIIRSFNHSIIRPFDHSIIRSFDHSIIRSFDHSIILAIRSGPGAAEFVRDGSVLREQAHDMLHTGGQALHLGEQHTWTAGTGR
jgi:hypothetical protein